MCTSVLISTNICILPYCNNIRKKLYVFQHFNNMFSVRRCCGNILFDVIRQQLLKHNNVTNYLTRTVDYRNSRIPALTTSLHPPPFFVDVLCQRSLQGITSVAFHTIRVQSEKKPFDVECTHPSTVRHRRNLGFYLNFCQILNAYLHLPLKIGDIPWVQGCIKNLTKI